jgi:putative ubiquitin-RnfH superfamily antitoxin RatB of RatAB toxin-antitoxin module
MGWNKMIKIEVAYARAAEQRIIPIEVAEGSTIEIAIHHSGILTLFPEIDLTTQVVGIFSAPKTLSTLVKEGDRIEIYRSLVIDPKEARRIKANALKR